MCKQKIVCLSAFSVCKLEKENLKWRKSTCAGISQSWLISFHVAAMNSCFQCSKELKTPDTWIFFLLSICLHSGVCYFFVLLFFFPPWSSIYLRKTQQESHSNLPTKLNEITLNEVTCIGKIKHEPENCVVMYF